MEKYLFLPFNISDSNKNKNSFSVENYNTKKNAELKNELHNINLDKINELYLLLGQYQENKRKSILKSIKEKIELNEYNIKGILYNYNTSFSITNKYTDLFLHELKYDIKFEIYKITNKLNNKILLSEKNKYYIIISNINEQTKKFLENNFLYYFRPTLLFTNLKVSLELNYSKGKIYFLFKNTYQSKIYMEINKVKDIEKSKKNFLSSGIYIDFLKLNEFSYIDWINTEKLFFGKNNNIKKTTLKNYNIDIDIDLKKYLEIETDSLYIENLKNEFFHYNLLKNININLCCYIKNISEDKNKKIINVILENLFDLNNIILEIPKEHKILDNLYINCIYIFTNLILFIDEKMNIKLTVQKNKSEKSEIIFLYFLVDIEKYYNKKLNNFLIENQFSQLLILVEQNKIIRTIKKYFVTIDKINYINLYFSDDLHGICYYDGTLECSDGTSTAFLKIKGNDISELKKLKININKNDYEYNEINSDKKITIYPILEENIQLVIIGSPIMKNTKEIPFLDIYDNINVLKKPKNKNDDLLNFDIMLTKNEFTIINGTFLKYSPQLKLIPIIKVIKYFDLDEYINLLESQKNKNDGIL